MNYESLFISIYEVYTTLTCLPPPWTQHRRNQKHLDRYTDVLSLDLTDINTIPRVLKITASW